jgi:hypothetical protein
MTKAFLEPILLKIENEKHILNAFSKKNLKKVKKFNTKNKDSLLKTTERKLSLDDLIVLS